MRHEEDNSRDRRKWVAIEISSIVISIVLTYLILLPPPNDKIHGQSLQRIVDSTLSDTIIIPNSLVPIIYKYKKQ